MPRMESTKAWRIGALSGGSAISCLVLTLWLVGGASDATEPPGGLVRGLLVALPLGAASLALVSLICGLRVPTRPGKYTLILGSLTLLWIGYEILYA